MDGRIVIFMLVFAVLILVGTPFLIIWALNTLGVANCPFTFWTWLAALCVILLFGAASKTNVSMNRKQ